MNCIICNITNKYVTITINPIIDSVVIHIINNISVNVINSNTYNNDHIIIKLLLSTVVVLQLIMNSDIMICMHIIDDISVINVVKTMIFKIRSLLLV